jgi:hypothetical protein
MGFTLLIVCEEVCIYWSAFLSVLFVRRDDYVSEERVVAQQQQQQQQQ